MTLSNARPLQLSCLTGIVVVSYLSTRFRVTIGNLQAEGECWISGVLAPMDPTSTFPFFTLNDPM